MNIDRKFSNGLMVANLIATVLVVSIHYGSKHSIPSTEIIGWNYLLQEFALNGIARIAVPFFALISGFFVAKKLSEKPDRIGFLKKKLATLLIPYLIASFLIFVCSAWMEYIFEHKPLQRITAGDFIISVFLRPVSVQFWFLRDLLILTFSSVFFVGWKPVYYKLLLLALSLLWLIDYQPFPIVFDWYLLNIETVFFFVLGGLLFHKGSIFNLIINTSVRNRLIVLLFWVSLLAFRVYLDPTLDVWYTENNSLGPVFLYKLAILLGICSLIQLSIYFHANRVLIYLSGLAFFVYLFHLVPLSYLRVVTGKLVDPQFAFYLDFPIALLVVILVAHFMARISPKTFALLTGGRNPDKALKLAQ